MTVIIIFKNHYMLINILTLRHEQGVFLYSSKI